MNKKNNLGLDICFLDEKDPIIVFRQHDQYLASQYRRFIKNGFKGEVESFFDVENDVGFFKKIHFNFSYQVEYLRQNLTQNHWCLFMKI